MVYELLLVVGATLGGLLLTMPFYFFMRENESLRTFLSGVVMVLVWYIYFFSAWKKKGQTLAMKTWHLFVRREGGAVAGTKELNLRFIWATVFVVFIPLLDYVLLKSFGFPPLMAFGFSLLWLIVPWGFAVVDKKKQFLYDRLAGTALYKIMPPREEPARDEQATSSKPKANSKKGGK